MNNTITQRYAHLLVQYIEHQDEEALAEIAELARQLIADTIPPEEIGEMHQKALAVLASKLPAETPLDKVLTPSTQPLIELLMAYGLLFRRDIEQQYSAMLKERLAQLQHLEAIGILAAGIAHDFNNLLGIIVGYADLVQAQTPENSPPQGWINNILSAAMRGQTLVDRILTFARQEQDSAEKSRVDMVVVIRETLELAKINLPRSTEIVFEHEADSIPIYVNPSHVQQIILNLVSNGSQAMQSGGRLTVRANYCILDDNDHMHPTLPPGRYARLSVADTGHGIARDILPRIFDPFYTTREVGQGTGLGLSVVHGNVTAMQGSVSVVSELGQGTEFTVLIPTVLPEPEPDKTNQRYADSPAISTNNS